MRLLRTTMATLLLTAACAAAAGGEDSLRCPGGLVAVGDPKIDLLGKCGEPALTEITSSEQLGVAQKERGPNGTARTGTRVTATVERWTYDFGPSQFVRVVTLEGGRVRAIEAGGRGYAEPADRRRPLPISTCDYMTIRVGDTAYDLLRRCGQPATKDLGLVERFVDLQDGSRTLHQVTTVPVEVWGFHFGPQTLTRIVELEEGKVTRVETGAHGYPPR